MKNIERLFKGKCGFIATFLLLFLLMFTITVLGAKFIGYPDRFRNKFYDPMSWNDIYANIDIFVIPAIVLSILLTIVIYYAERRKIIYNENQYGKECSNDPVLDEIIQDALQSGKKEEKKEDVQEKSLDTKADSK
ncbi:MAG: hypothetical protein EOL95_11770 [Bacteroidia bacterium]|nr:hypothetical protein [Bacteroidia bacterium]